MLTFSDVKIIFRKFKYIRISIFFDDIENPPKNTTQVFPKGKRTFFPNITFTIAWLIT